MWCWGLGCQPWAATRIRVRCSISFGIIIADVQQGIFTWLSSCFKKPTWSEQVFKPPAAWWMFSPPSERFPVHITSSPSSHLSYSHACWHFDLFQMQLSWSHHQDSHPFHLPSQLALPSRGSNWLAWLPRGAWHRFPCLTNRSAGLLPQLSFLQEVFSRLCLPWGDQVPSGCNPTLPLQLTDGGALPKTSNSTTPFNFCIFSWAYFIKECL